MTQTLPTHADWISAEPWPHVVIDDYWPAHLAQQAADEFPDPDDRGKVHRFTGPLEDGKMEASAATAGPQVAAIHDWFASPEFLGWVRELVGDPGLIADPERTGAGIHMMGRGARLGVHTDFSRMPSDRSFVRRVNLILFLEEWDEGWGGATELCEKVTVDHGPGLSESMMAWGADVFPAPGRLLLFESSERSWHGVPTPLSCPEGVYRRTIPAYLFSPEREGDPPAHSTIFVG